MDSICISSLVVQTAPALRDKVHRQLAGLPGVFVLGDNGNGKLAVLLDANGLRAAADSLDAGPGTALSR